MSLQTAASGDRVHIGFFGCRNAGKSSLVNAFTNQQLSVVSNVRGTTTDPVKKAMELLPMGPVMIIDTPGVDDEGALGEQRVKKAKQVLNRCDIAILVADGTKPLHPADEELLRLFSEKELPYVVVRSKCDLLEAVPETDGNTIYVSAEAGVHIEELKELVGHMTLTEERERPIVRDLLSPSDLVVLVTPIDASAPKGRMILPQVQTMRDILDAHAGCMVVQDTELKGALEKLCQPPKMVITDSQAFGRVSADTPKEILLTSFSILFARYKGVLAEAVHGAAMLDTLHDGDKILISEGCTHHRQCEDIGTVKLPGWIQKHTGKKLEFAFSSGTEFPEDLSPYRLVIHCGACTLNPREMRYRQKCAADQKIPMTNYGIAIAHLHGILERSLEPFPEIAQLLKH